MVLPPNKGNVTVVLSTADCNHKEDQAYRRLKEDQNESIEKILLLLKKPSFSKVHQQGWLQDL
jgi:hypothetical protein